MKFIVAESLSTDVINEFVIDHSDGPVIVYTDEYRVYNELSELSVVVDHRRVDHSKGVFADGDAHINTARASVLGYGFFGFIMALIEGILQF